MKDCLREQGRLDLVQHWDDLIAQAIKGGMDPLEAEAHILKVMLDEYQGKSEMNRTKAIQAVKLAHVEQELNQQLADAQKWYDERLEQVYKPLKGVWSTLYQRPTMGTIYRDLLQSVDHRARTLEQRYLSGLPIKDVEVLKSPDAMAEVFRVLRGGTTQDAGANSVALIFKDVLEQQQKDRWKAGALWVTRKDYSPQKWSSALFDGTEANRVKFREDALRRFSWGKMTDPTTHKPFTLGPRATLPEVARMEEFIEEMYEDLYTDGARYAARQKEQGVVPGSTPKRAIYKNDPRIVEMEDFDNFMYMNEAWGWGKDNLLNMLMDHIRGESTDIALMQKLGPMTNNSHAWLSQGFDDAYASQSDMMYTLLARSYSGKANMTRHGYTTGMHSLLRASLLGNAFLASPSDLVLSGQMAALNGLRSKGLDSSLQYYANLRQFSGRTGDQAALIPGYNANVIANQLSDTLLASLRYGGDAAEGRQGKALTWLNKSSNQVMKWSYLQKATEDLGDTMSMALAGDLGYYSKGKVKWGDLPEDFRRSALKNGIDADRWQHVLATPHHSNQGTDAFLDYRTVKDAETSRRLADWDGALRMAVTNTPDLRLRTVTTGGAANLGTFRRAAASSIFMFKSWPIQVMRNFTLPLLDRAMRGDITPLAYTAAGLFVMGGLSIQLKNIFQGKSPEDMLSTRFVSRAFLQGGLGGLAVDLAVQEEGYMDSLARSLGGPAVGMVEDFLRIPPALGSSVFDWENETLSKQVFYFISRYNPVAAMNIWYTQAATDRLIYDTISALPVIGDPGFYERQELRETKQYNESGQVDWWSRTNRNGIFPALPFQ